jgi:hypothetical protein
MANVHYEARLILIAGEINLYRQAPIEALSFDSHMLRPKSANGTRIMTLLGQAKAGKAITVYKTPSSKDDLDAVLIGLAGSKQTFGFNLDLYANDEGSRVHFVHFFQEDATFSEMPSRIGGGKDVLLKMQVALPKADFKHAEQQHGHWVDDDWNR